MNPVDQDLFSDLARTLKHSFIREVLGDAIKPGAISFAGGLPKAECFPVDALQEASNRVFADMGAEAFQYAPTQGYAGLRQWIADHYSKTHGFAINPETILITNGSQQGIELVTRALISPDEEVAIESPSYLGAIQALQLNGAKLTEIPLHAEGMDVAALENWLRAKRRKFLYTVPIFQNPTGVTYSDTRRAEIADLVGKTSTFILEDNPYESINFTGEHHKSFYAYLPEQTLMLGTFSKSVVPGLRLGWIVAPPAILEKLAIIKQASDLHSNIFSQYMMFAYLQNNDLAAHCLEATKVYQQYKDLMLVALKKHMHNSVKVADPKGGMFLWLEFPENVDTLALFKRCAERQVFFVPGQFFYVDRPKIHEARLSFSNVNADEIERGIAIMASEYHD